MKKITSSTILILLITLVGFSFQGCRDDHEPKVTVYVSPTFKAVNRSVVSEKELFATDNKVITNITLTVTLINSGIEQSFTVSHKSNELPVMETNEVELIPTFDNESASDFIRFTFPDQTSQRVSKYSGSCKWIVPKNFIGGDKIIAQWVDKNDRVIAENLYSYINLIPFN